MNSAATTNNQTAQDGERSNRRQRANAYPAARGWTLRRTLRLLERDESDGVKYYFREYDSLEIAEAVKNERPKAGWGPIQIEGLARPPIDLRAIPSHFPSPEVI